MIHIDSVPCQNTSTKFRCTKWTKFLYQTLLWYAWFWYWLRNQFGLYTIVSSYRGCNKFINEQWPTIYGTKSYGYRQSNKIFILYGTYPNNYAIDPCFIQLWNGVGRFHLNLYEYLHLTLGAPKLPTAVIFFDMAGGLRVTYLSTDATAIEFYHIANLIYKWYAWKEKILCPVFSGIQLKHVRVTTSHRKLMGYNYISIPYFRVNYVIKRVICGIG